MSVTGRPETVPPDEPARTQRALAAALWHYSTTPVVKPYHVRGCVPDPAEPRVTVALWTGPAAREKMNFFLSFPLVADGVPVSATRIVVALLRLGRGTHVFGFTGHRFDGKRLLDGGVLLEGVRPYASPGGDGEEQGPRGFYFERPGQLRRY
ncbi:hypothetical protein [Streptomyces filamentosus]|uniref:hypothetical protein n=1 Tax=Streptomyces filamentosus TaxID=67294 RepID=UPI0033D3C24E